MSSDRFLRGAAQRYLRSSGVERKRLVCVSAVHLISTVQGAEPRFGTRQASRCSTTVAC
jgi:hypothetical protein